MAVSIRNAIAADAALVERFVRALAEYEKLTQEVKAGAADFSRELFGPSPRAFCEIAEWEDEPAGFAIWFYTFSTFEGRCGLWLEDLFVDPAFRGKGIGKALLVNLAQRCVREDLKRFEWAVLDWNQPSIDFYKGRGARIMGDWQHCRVDGDALLALGRA